MSFFLLFFISLATTVSDSVYGSIVPDNMPPVDKVIPAGKAIRDQTPGEKTSEDISAGNAAGNRVPSDHQDLPLSRLLHLTNRFYNERIEYAPERADHWLQREELLRYGRGDCEDFALSKYQHLLEQGVSGQLFSFLYARQNPSGQAHIALLYKPDNLVLDILTDKILPLAQRTDLTPVLEFTAESYQLLGQQQRLSRGEFSTLIRWQKVLSQAERHSLNRKG